MELRWPRRLLACAVAVALVPSSTPASAASVALPSSMVALGDSISRGFDACGFYVDCPRRSWSTGDDPRVDSQRTRLGAAGDQTLVSTNLARTGARVDQLTDEADDAVAAHASYVTIEIGANDACRGSVSEMTSVADFRTQLRAGLAELHEGLPQVRVFIASIPDLLHLWSVGHSDRFAQFAWAKLHMCRSMLDRPESMAPADVARRTEVRRRVEAYNAELSAACRDFGANCRDDGGAVFAARFGVDELSKWDWFHPNLAGQHELAELTWAAGFFR
jgi:lysophospholipase L1-like esterase